MVIREFSEAKRVLEISSAFYGGNGPSIALPSRGVDAPAFIVHSPAVGDSKP